MEHKEIDQIPYAIHEYSDGHSCILTRSGRVFHVRANPHSVASMIAHKSPDIANLTRVLDEANLADQTAKTATSTYFKPSLNGSGHSNLLEVLNSSTDNRILLLDVLNVAAMISKENRCIKESTRFVTIYPKAGFLVVTPVFGAHSLIKVGDYVERAMASASSQGVIELTLEKPEYGELEISKEQIETAFLIAESKLLNSSSRPDVALAETIIGDFTLQESSVLPMPYRRSTETLPKALLGWPALVSPTVGIVTKVEAIKLTSDHHDHYVAQAWCADTRRLTGRDISAANAGFSETNQYEASLISVAESVERYCGAFEPENQLRGSHRDLHREWNLIHPKEFPLFAESQRNIRDRYARFDEATPVTWVKAESLEGKEAAYVPGSLALLDWCSGIGRAEPRIAPTNFAGIAAGTDKTQALLNGIEEVVERDAMISWWSSGTRAEEIIFDDIAAEKGLDIWWLRIPSDSHIPVVACVVHDVLQEFVVAGFACRDSESSACYKAYTEAIALQQAALELMKPEGLWKKKSDRWGSLNLKPYREDRNYLSGYSSEFEDITGLFGQIQANLDKDIYRESLRRLLPVSSRPMSSENIDRSLSAYMTANSAMNLQWFAVDLTTHDVQACNFGVWRVMAPGALPNFPTGLPALSHNRLFSRIQTMRGTGDGTPWPAHPLPYA